MEQLFKKMWQAYTSITPIALKVEKLITDKGEDIVNDHIALRTFNLDGIGLDSLAKHFKGYKPMNDYHFKEKKLYAKHFEHSDSRMPKIFISELLLEEFSEGLQQKIKGLVNEMDFNQVKQDDFLYSGRHWKLSYKEYQDLLKESEYAAWVAAFGFIPNHFTVLVNELKNFKELRELNDFLKREGIKLNESGGEVKGTPQELLEQSSTLASKFPCQFSDGTYEIPSCYYEFAKRYPKKDGLLYQGFIAQSADKIFESTNKAQ